jgi:hypothetical protein
LEAAAWSKRDQASVAWSKRASRLNFNWRTTGGPDASRQFVTQRDRTLFNAERIMAITISNLVIGNNVPAGTTIGVLTASDGSGSVIPCNFLLTKGSIGYFAIAGNNLVTSWSVPAIPGHYSVRIRAIGSSTLFSGSATFTVDVGIAAPPPAPPPPPPRRLQHRRHHHRRHRRTHRMCRSTVPVTR